MGAEGAAALEGPVPGDAGLPAEAGESRDELPSELLSGLLDAARDSRAWKRPVLAGRPAILPVVADGQEAKTKTKGKKKRKENTKRIL